MVIAFQIVLLIVIVLGFMGVVGEKQDTKLRKSLTAVSIAGMASFIISVLWL